MPSDRQRKRGLWQVTRFYVICQLGGWGAWTFLFALVSSTRVPHTAAAIARLTFSYLLYAVYGLLVTHALYLLLRRSWLRLPASGLVLRVMTFVVAGAALLVVALNWINGRWLHLLGGSMEGEYLIFFVNALFLLGGWLVLFFLFEQMRTRRVAERQRVETELRMREAQYQALSSQVNPHFLFNALNTVRALIYEDPREADRALTRLAALLRAGLQGETRREVTLREELVVVEDYLALEKLRFEERLHVSVFVEEGLEGAMLPPMTLQHLVENAIKHGIARLTQGGRVEVRAARAGERMELLVSNPSTAEEGDGRDAFTSNGTGLRNTRERLRLLYGEGAELVAGLVEDGFAVRMRVPLRMEAADARPAD